MAGKEFWTRPKVEHLCNLWKIKPSLHNVDNDHYDRWHKRRDTEEIAEHLGTTVEELLKKMKNLRSQYARERRKTRFSAVDNCQVSSSKWYLLSVLKFLEKSDALMESVEEASEEGGEDRLNAGAKEGGELSSQTPSRPQNGRAGSPPAEKRARSVREERQPDAGVAWETPAREGPAEDPCDIFGKYVASELRQMETAHMRKVARLRIQQVLVDAQLDVVVQPANLEHPLRDPERSQSE